MLIAFFLMKDVNALATQQPTKQPDHSEATKDIADKEEGIYFDQKWVEAGVPLKVKNAPKGATFNWQIISADGIKQTFTTQENSYTPIEADQEKLITVSVEEDANLSASIYFSSLPVVYINNELGYNGVGDIFTDAAMNIQGSKLYSNGKQLYKGDIKLKVNVDSTKSMAKKPFDIELRENTDLLGMGKNKKWSMLVSVTDHTLMRNKLLYEFSKDIGMNIYSKSENVILVFNNKYYGVYQFCEPVDIGTERVDIYDWENAAEQAANAIVDQVLNSKDINNKATNTSGINNSNNNIIDNANTNLSNTINNIINNTNTNINQSKVINEEEIESLKYSVKVAMCQDLSWMSSPYAFRYDVDGDGTPETYIIGDYVKLPPPTGGVLMEMGLYGFNKNNPSSMVTDFSQPLSFKFPQYTKTNSELYANIQDYIQSFEHALHSTDFTYHDQEDKYRAINRNGGNKNSGYERSNFSAPEYDGKHYSELFDMDSLVNNLLVKEFSMNWDSLKNNEFMYKDIDGLFSMGPVWDFENAWGNINRDNQNTWFPDQWYTTSSYFSMEQYYQSVQWNRSLLRDPYFLVKFYEKYKKVRKTAIENMIKDGGKIDTYAKRYQAAAAANDIRWGHTYQSYEGVGFDESVQNMKDFITARVDWMDQQMASLDSMIESLHYYSPSQDLKITKVDKNAVNNYVEITAKISDPNITSVRLLVNGAQKYVAKVKKGKVVTKIPADSLVSTSKFHNIVQILGINSKGNYVIDTVEQGNYSLAKSNYTIFYYDKNIDGIKQSVNEAVTAVKKQTTGYNILLLIAGIVCVVSILGIVVIAKARKS